MKIITIILLLVNFILADIEEKTTNFNPSSSPLRVLGQSSDSLLFGAESFKIDVHVKTDGELKANKKFTEKVKKLFQEAKMPLYEKGDSYSFFGIIVMELDSELLVTTDFNFGVWSTVDLLLENENVEEAILQAAKEFIRQFKYDNRSAEEVFASYKKLAQEKDVHAQYELAMCYLHGRLIKADKERFLYWLEKAAHNGHIKAQTNMGMIYQNNDKKKSYKWFSKAANQGDSESQFEMAMSLIEGAGVKTDLTEAHNWLLKAAEQDHPDAQYNLATMYKNGDGVAKDQKKAFQFYLASAENRNARGELMTGLFYSQGLGTVRDMKKAKEYIQRAKEQGLNEANEVWESLQLFNY